MPLPTRPTVSFILATHNRGPVLIDCLSRTLQCGLPESQFSIVVIDNASTDGTPELVHDLAKTYRNIHLFRLNRNCGPVAKNLGIHRNPADILVLLDDDAYPMPGSVSRMIGHFRDDPRLAAAVFDVTLPDGSKEASAYPDVFIGAGTALRNAVIRQVAGQGLLPRDFFMQAEEYDLSFRLLALRDEEGNGYSVQRFWDMPLMHLKSPGARIGQRTTRLDVRNNLYVLAKYLPEPLCHQLAADWLARYWLMAAKRDAEQPAHAIHGTHKQAYLRGTAEGLGKWSVQRAGGKQVLPAETIERIFKFGLIERRLGRVMEKRNLRRIAFADVGKNMLAYYQAAARLHMPVAAVLDENLGAEEKSGRIPDYRGIPILGHDAFRGRKVDQTVDALILTTISPVHAQRRAEALRRTYSVPVVDLFSHREAALLSEAARITTPPGPFVTATS